MKATRKLISILIVIILMSGIIPVALATEYEVNSEATLNVIYLLTAGGPVNPKLLTSGGSAGYTDLLVTWLFNMTTGAESNYKLAAVIGIMIFVVVAVTSLIVYNAIPSTRNEEDYQ